MISALLAYKHFFTTGQPYFFNYVQEMMSLSSSIALNGNTMPKLMFQGETMIFRSHEITLGMISSAVHQALSEMDKILHQHVFLDLEPTVLCPDWTNLSDDISNGQWGYSVLEDASNPFSDKRDNLAKALLTHPNLSKTFGYVDERGQVHWNPTGVRQWFKNVEDFKKKLYFACHLVGGMPARGGEETYQQFANTLTRSRNLHVLLGFVCQVGKYNKTSNNMVRDKYIARALPSPVAKLLITYLAVVRPMERMLLHVVTDGDNYDSLYDKYGTHLWISPTGLYDSRAFSAILRDGLQPFLRFQVGLADMRHILIGFWRRVIDSRAMKTVGFDQVLEAIGDLQAGHSSDVALAHYARDSGGLDEIPEKVLKQFVLVRLLLLGIVATHLSHMPLFREVFSGTRH